jgi:integral membrane protein
VRTAYGRYRVLAYVVGTLLVVLVFVGVPLKHFAGKPQVASVVGVTHGVLYMVYLAAALQLAIARRWSLTRIAVVFAAGLVPFLTFYMERLVTREERARA